MTLSATSENNLGVVRLIANLPSVVASCVRLQLRPLPSTGVTRLRQYYEPLRHPIRPGLSLTSCQLIFIVIAAGASRVASGLLYVHAIAITPAGSMELVRSSISIVNGLPCVTVRSAPAITFSGPAQRLLTLWPARSRSRLATLSIECSDSFVASAAASIATGWSEPVPGRELHPLKSSAFHGALFRQLSDRGYNSRCHAVPTKATTCISFGIHLRRVAPLLCWTDKLLRPAAVFVPGCIR